jgi:hypothetical protein
MTLSTILADLFEQDLRTLIREVEQFHDEEALWTTKGNIRNSAGNLVLHLVGGMNFRIGALLAKNGYVRNRDAEFSTKGVPRAELIEQVQKLIPVVTHTVGNLSQEDMDALYPEYFDKPDTTNAYVLTKLANHLNYHLGQVNYLRRMLQAG